MTAAEKLTIKLNHIVLVKGFEQLSMTQLAKLAGVSRATLYAYFKNKDEIVRSVVDRHDQFIQQHAIPTEIKAEDVPTVLLNALLVIGSTTDQFEQELQHSMPQLYRTFYQTYRHYLADLEAYYAQAEQQGIMRTDAHPHYLVFQNILNVRGTLKQVEQHHLTLEKGAHFLRDYFQVQLTVLFKLDQPLLPAALVQRILAEYEATYSLF
ncbi:hypothetical protein IV38_GL001686 [Lactobacillus selangorensis]|uniref:HTH tetR-type domain-containing protein n=1 Tax=Lactobacillus selangorensis TaxID=81857 RepID=A0A0R2G088_9LACO|nr:TetR/AcrR family transcriptional regulator [Lactobacillus selangorensis]KRN28232.1 hypothetical protein IV38_GL001686 [Lactobacillus selangorensis]KRN30892.1 hypothetical protein IV40_GL001529 [Lactobacillus selangorensis]